MVVSESGTDRQPPRLSEVHLRADAHALAPGEELLGRAAAHADVELRAEVLHVYMVALARPHHSDAARAAALHRVRHDGHLLHRVGALGELRHQRVPRLVHRREPPVGGAHHGRVPRHTDEHLIPCRLDRGHTHLRWEAAAGEGEGEGEG